MTRFWFYRLFDTYTRATHISEIILLSQLDKQSIMSYQENPISRKNYILNVPQPPYNMNTSFWEGTRKRYIITLISEVCIAIS